MNDWNALITELETLSREMLSLAQSGEWEGVIEREERRRDLIEALLEYPERLDLATRLQSCIREILANDEAIIALGRQEKQGIAEKLENLGQGRKAQRAYNAYG